MESKLDLIKKHTTEKLTNDGLFVKVDYSAAMDEYAANLLDSNRKLREALEECRLQIEYLHGIFDIPTGTGNTVLTMIEQTLNDTGV